MRRRGLAWFGGLLVGLLAGLLVAGPARAAEDPAEPSAEPRLLVMLPLPPEHFRPDRHYAGGYGDALGRAARRRVAERIARDHGLQVQEGWPMPLIGVDCYLMSASAQQAAQRALQALAQDPRVAWAQAMQSFHGQGHADPLYAVQPAATAWHLDELHAWATGRGVRVAVIDSGVAAGHPDLAGQLLDNRNLIAAGPVPAEQHGTAVAGIVAARADDGQGIVGIAPGARVLALRACSEEPGPRTQCSSLGIAKALQAAISDAVDVINLSLAGPVDRLLGELLAVARARGIAVVAAVDPALPQGGFPASSPGVVAVAAQGGEAGVAGALFAPGRDVPVPAPPARWRFVSGSSYAAAHVSGLLALLREREAGAGAAALPVVGDGSVDACAAMARVTAHCVCACTVAQTLSPAALWRP